MNCTFCGAPTKSCNTTFICEQDEGYLVVEDVPAEVCSQCGEKTFSPEVTDRILSLARNGERPEKTLTVPIYHYTHQYR